LCDTAARDAVSAIYKNEAKFMDFYHNQDLKVFGKIAQFHTCDYRSQKMLTSLSNKAFSDFITTNKEYYKEQLFMNNLPYFNLKTDAPWGSFHVFKNIGYNLIECFKGNRAKRTNEIVDYKPPWVYSNDEQNKIDAHINCILTPSGMKNEFAIKNVFQQTGYLRCADLIKFVKILLNLISYIAPRVNYDVFYQIISEDFCNLLAPFFSEEDLDELQNRLFETVALHEGLFPITESRFSYHQLIHLVQTIRNWEPLTNSSEAAGERAIGIMSELPWLSILSRMSQYYV